MAKKKNNNKNKGDSDAQPKAAAAAAPAEAQPEPAPVEPATAEAPADASSSLAVDELTIDQLRAEVLSQRQQLAAKDAEISQLKSQLQQGGKSALPLADKSYPDVDSLRSRLEALRKEQEDADSARDKAWSQLKRVVGEISKLASPDYVTSLVQKSQSGDGKNNDLDLRGDKGE